MPCRIVAETTHNTIGMSQLVCLLVIASSMRYFVEAGRINPETRLTTMRLKPKAITPRRGLRSARTSGSNFQSNFARAEEFELFWLGMKFTTYEVCDGYARLSFRSDRSRIRNRVIESKCQHPVVSHARAGQSRSWHSFPAVPHL